MINVIGIGQNRENMTLGAVKAIEESDVIIGYKKGFIWEVLTVLGVLVAIMVSWVVAPGLADIIYIFPKNIAPFQGTMPGGRLSVYFLRAQLDSQMQGCSTSR